MRRRKSAVLVLLPLVIITKELYVLQSNWLHQSQQEITATNELRHLGASVQWAWRLDPNIQKRQIDGDRSPSWFLPGDGFAEGVYLVCCRENQLDEKLAPLQSLRRLRCLALGGSAITDASLAHLRDLKRLEWLDLHNTPISDEGLRSLGDDAPLVTLNLFNTEITDASVPLLATFQQLKRLNLGQTGVSAAGLAALRKQLPDVLVETGSDFDQRPLSQPWNLRNGYSPQ